jgi:hypothetical protein
LLAAFRLQLLGRKTSEVACRDGTKFSSELDFGKFYFSLILPHDASGNSRVNKSVDWQKNNNRSLGNISATALVAVSVPHAPGNNAISLTGFEQDA